MSHADEVSVRARVVKLEGKLQWASIIHCPAGFPFVYSTIRQDGECHTWPHSYSLKFRHKQDMMTLLQKWRSVKSVPWMHVRGLLRIADWAEVGWESPQLTRLAGCLTRKSMTLENLQKMNRNQPVSVRILRFELPLTHASNVYGPFGFNNLFWEP